MIDKRSAGPHYPRSRSAPITGLIIVRNQESTIGGAVASLAWCEQVVVFDQSSDDDTAAVARRAGADVRTTAVTGVVEPARRAALDAVAADWVLFLDGDEMVPAALAHALVAEVRRGRSDGVAMARRNYLLGHWAKGAGWWPDYQTRMFRKSQVVLPTDLHGAITVRAGAEVTMLPARADLALVHFNYTGLDDWVSRANRYTTLQATGVVFEKNVSGRAAVREFLTRFLKGGGWRLGRHGARLSLLGAMYTWLYVEKAVEAAAGGETGMRAAYDTLADDLLSGRENT